MDLGKLQSILHDDCDDCDDCDDDDDGDDGDDGVVWTGEGG